MLQQPVDKTGLLNHLDFTSKIKGKDTPVMIRDGNEVDMGWIYSALDPNP